MAGVVAGACSLTVMATLCGFLANAVVTRTVDHGPAVPRGEAIAIDVLLVAVFGLQHTWMARESFKLHWRRFVPQPFERSAYALAASLAILLLMTQWLPIPALVWRVDVPLARIALWSAFAAGWLLMAVSAVEMDVLDLCGLRQALDHARGRPTRGARFRVAGLHRFVRHPTYLGWILAAWSTPAMSAGHALLAASTTLYVLIAIRFEERDLVREHGELYDRYRRAVPMLVPWRGLAHARAE